ncbi:MAG TPA: hypothetical protein VIL85_07685 [Thermomicrobiales bacterium]|jgi:hypothetical protein
MRTSAKVALLTVALAIPTIPLGQLLWQAPPDAGHGPAPALLPFFILLAAAEGLAFGFGVAFLFLGWPLVRRATAEAGVATLPVYLSIAWSLLQWWPHSNSHRVIGEDYVKLLLVDYGFHVTLMIGAAIIAHFFLATMRRSRAVTAPTARGTAPVAARAS